MRYCGRAPPAKQTACETLVAIGIRRLSRRPFPGRAATYAARCLPAQERQEIVRDHH